MKLFLIYFILVSTISCSNNKKNKFCRTWENISAQNKSFFIDTVNNSFIPIDSLAKKDSTFFRVCFEKPINLWIKGSHSSSFYKILSSKKVYYKSDSIRMVKCISSLDSTREDHILSFIILENVGIVFEANPSMRSTYILEKLVDIENRKNLIDNNYVKSLYSPNVITPL